MESSKHQHLRVVDYDEMMKLYEAGKTDSQIAKAMGLTEQSLVNKWRRRYKLPSHEKLKGPIKFDRDEAMQLYQDGLSDIQISDRLNVTRSTILYWRKKHNMPPNVSAPQKKKENETVNPKAELNVTLHPEIAVKAQSTARPFDQSGDDIPTVKTINPLLSQSARDMYLEEIELLKSEKNELLAKNSELAGFIDGMIFLANTIARILNEH